MLPDDGDNFRADDDFGRLSAAFFSTDDLEQKSEEL
jgi:hypothetical protein